MRQEKKIADWATEGAKVWIQLDSYGLISRYRAGTIKRVTKANVFVTLDGATTGIEYRFSGIQSSYLSWEERKAGVQAEVWMEEYGARNDIYGWRGRKHLYAADSKIVVENKERADRDELENKARAAAKHFGVGRLTDKSRYAEGKLAIAAIEAWLAVVPEDER